MDSKNAHIDQCEFTKARNIFILRIIVNVSVLIFFLSFFIQLAILTELTHSHSGERGGLLTPAHPGAGSIYHSENLSLKLSPPPMVEE